MNEVKIEIPSNTNLATTDSLNAKARRGDLQSRFKIYLAGCRFLLL